jgi:hypothetical protein
MPSKDALDALITSRLSENLEPLAKVASKASVFLSAVKPLLDLADACKKKPIKARQLILAGLLEHQTSRFYVAEYLAHFSGQHSAAILKRMADLVGSIVDFCSVKRNENDDCLDITDLENKEGMDLLADLLTVLDPTDFHIDFSKLLNQNRDNYRNSNSVMETSTLRFCAHSLLSLERSFSRGRPQAATMASTVITYLFTESKHKQKLYSALENQGSVGKSSLAAWRPFLESRDDLVERVAKILQEKSVSEVEAILSNIIDEQVKQGVSFEHSFKSASEKDQLTSQKETVKSQLVRSSKDLYQESKLALAFRSINRLAITVTPNILKILSENSKLVALLKELVKNDWPKPAIQSLSKLLRKISTDEGLPANIAASTPGPNPPLSPTDGCSKYSDLRTKVFKVIRHLPRQPPSADSKAELVKIESLPEEKAPPKVVVGDLKTDAELIEMGAMMDALLDFDKAISCRQCRQKVVLQTGVASPAVDLSSYSKWVAVTSKGQTVITGGSAATCYLHVKADATTPVIQPTTNLITLMRNPPEDLLSSPSSIQSVVLEARESPADVDLGEGASLTVLLIPCVPNLEADDRARLMLALRPVVSHKVARLIGELPHIQEVLRNQVMPQNKQILKKIESYLIRENWDLWSSSLPKFEAGIALTWPMIKLNIALADVIKFAAVHGWLQVPAMILRDQAQVTTEGRYLMKKHLVVVGELTPELAGQSDLAIKTMVELLVEKEILEICGAAGGGLEINRRLSSKGDLKTLYDVGLVIGLMKKIGLEIDLEFGSCLRKLLCFAQSPDDAAESSFMDGYSTFYEPTERQLIEGLSKEGTCQSSIPVSCDYRLLALRTSRPEEKAAATADQSHGANNANAQPPEKAAVKEESDREYSIGGLFD